jgi:hypothetical protein
LSPQPQPWENYSPEPPAVYFPIYRSKDHGKTWNEISRVHDPWRSRSRSFRDPWSGRWGSRPRVALESSFPMLQDLRYQPFLYSLPERVGSFKKGTLLLAGSSIPTDLSSRSFRDPWSGRWGSRPRVALESSFPMLQEGHHLDVPLLLARARRLIQKGHSTPSR